MANLNKTAVEKNLLKLSNGTNEGHVGRDVLDVDTTGINERRYAVNNAIENVLYKPKPR